MEKKSNQRKKDDAAIDVDTDYQHENADSNEAHVAFILSFYGIPKSWDYWASKPQLMAEEAIPLMYGMPPDIWRKRKSYRHSNVADPQWEDWVDCIKEELKRSEHSGSFKQLKTPAGWLNWGRANGLDQPLLKRPHEPAICMWSPFASAVERLTNSQSDEKEDIKVLREGKNKFTPRDALGRLMLNIANTFAKNRNGATINGNEMLSLLQEKGATIKKSDKEYVRYTDTVIKKVISISKNSFEGRLTRTRNHVKDNYPT